MENISTLENSSSLVSITLKENKLKKDGTYYATVTISTEEENVLSLGAPAKITGANLKLGSEESGIYFAAISSDEKLEDSSTWTRLDDSKVFRNKPAELNFFVPQTLDSSKEYKVVKKTNYISASVTRKEFLESVSSAVKIKE